MGLNLRDLLSAVDKEISHIPADKHREVCYMSQYFIILDHIACIRVSRSFVDLHLTNNASILL